ncbi:uridine kinase [Kitasatospora sp. NPDC058965]|uniref:uridine kinase family protein n=1 Tax=Kitasatospora sp. NPDC058965 TaxID=3346682 RepID=UPI0036A2BE7D
MQATALLLTLTGGAGAGKTTLAEVLAATAPAGPAHVLHGDDYYFAGPDRGVWAPDEAGVPRLDVGDPRSVDAERLAADTGAALAAGPVVIVDGLFARRVNAPRQARHRRLDVFVDVPADLRLARKIDRKCVRGGFPVDVLLHNYVHHRRAAHDRHVEPLRDGCDLVLDGTLPPQALAEQVWSAVAARTRQN